MKTIHVCLVSEQTVPNILAIEHFGADELLLVSTEKMEAAFKSQHILDCLAARGMDYGERCHKIIVTENSLVDCHQKLEAWVQKCENSEFTVNLTGGTKIMSIATYALFKEYGSLMVYIPIGKNEYTVVYPRRGVELAENLTQRLSVVDYLTAYGLTAINAKHLDGLVLEARRQNKLVQSIVLNYDAVKNLLKWLSAELREHRLDRSFVLKNNFPGATEKEKALLSQIGFSVLGSSFEKLLSKHEIQFLTGGWLEVFCFNTVASLKDRGIDDVVVGIQVKSLKGASNEFDVMFTKDNALYTIECKSLDQAADTKADALYKIAALQRDFGLRVRSFLVSTSPHILGKDGRLKPAIATRAKQLNTVVVPPNRVPDLSRCLADELALG